MVVSSLSSYILRVCVRIMWIILSVLPCSRFHIMFLFKTIFRDRFEDPINVVFLNALLTSVGFIGHYNLIISQLVQRRL